jgi:hypothetical protein
MNTFTDIEAEKPVIGWLNFGNGFEEINKLAPDINPQWFSILRPAFLAAKEIEHKGKVVTAERISDELRQSGHLEEIGIHFSVNDSPDLLQDCLEKLRTRYERRYVAEVAAEMAKGMEWEEAIKLLEMLRSEHQPGNTELFTDLSSFLDGTQKQEVPMVAEAHDGKFLFYAGRLNEVHAEPGTGKTNVLTASCISVLEEGGKVLYIDPEDTPKGFATRMMMLGATPDDIRENVFYLHNPDTKGIRSAQAWAKANHPDIVILDGLAESMAAQGFNEDKAPDVLAYFRENLRPFAEAGSAVVIADHVTKSSENRGQFARGSGAKAGRYDGVSYEIATGVAYTPNQAGFVKLKIAKDRNGGAGARKAIYAELHFTPGVDGRTITAFREPKEKQGGVFRPTAIMEKILEYLKEHGEANKRALRGLGKSQYADDAIELLLKDEKILFREEGKSHVYTLNAEGGKA